MEVPFSYATSAGDKSVAEKVDCSKLYYCMFAILERVAGGDTSDWLWLGAADSESNLAYRDEGGWCA